jgi:hypothetical protein
MHRHSPGKAMASRGPRDRCFSSRSPVTGCWLVHLCGRAAGASVELAQYIIQMMRDTLENWQSEFLQLSWRGWPSILLHVRLPQAKEGDDRIDAKIDEILFAVKPKKGDRLITEIDEKYEGRPTDHCFVRMLEKR